MKHNDVKIYRAQLKINDVEYIFIGHEKYVISFLSTLRIPFHDVIANLNVIVTKPSGVTREKCVGWAHHRQKMAKCTTIVTTLIFLATFPHP